MTPSKSFCDWIHLRYSLAFDQDTRPSPERYPGSSPGGGKHCCNCPFQKKRSKQEFNSIRPKQSIAIQTERGHIDATMHSDHWTTNAKPVAESVATIALSTKPSKKNFAQNRVQAGIRPKQNIAIKECKKD